jgi:2-polyprenyl-6-methoxyphenol hydroxylase-like FAD-dependent oxidoreductase
MSVDRTSVLVVGAGPAGMVAALELAQHGVACILIEQAWHATHHPKMDVVNTRSMELLDRLGLAEPIRAAGVAADHPSDVIWSTGLAGQPITVWHQPSVAEYWRRISRNNDGSQPAQPWQRLSQIVLEPLLRRRCQQHPLIDLRCGRHFDSLSQDRDGVTSLVTNIRHGVAEVIRSDYVIGCDGAASQVRHALGIALTGFAVPELPAAYMIHFRSRDVSTLHRHGRFWHYFAFRYVILAQDEVDTWTLHVNAADPAEFDIPPTDPAGFARQILGTDLDIDSVQLTTRWRPKFLIADQYHHDRVLLAGDAVHQMFPTGGYGMNTGVADAIDAAWKVAAMVKEVGGPALIDSYGIERRPVGLRNMDTSHRHLGVHLAAGKLLAEGAELPAIAGFLQRHRGENEYAGIELGYRYDDSPVVCHENTGAPSWTPERYTPTTWPGGRPPSVILGRGQPLYGELGSGFTLVDFAGNGRAAPLLQAAHDIDLPIRHVVVADDHARELWERDLVLLRPDQHVGWRGNSAPPDAGRVLDRLLGRTAGAGW